MPADFGGIGPIPFNMGHSTPMSLLAEVNLRAARTLTPARRGEPIDWNRALRAVAVGAAVVVLVRAVVYYLAIPEPDLSLGVDYRLYTEAAQGWLDTGHFYPPRQLAGPYTVLGAGEILYPPIILLLLVPFTFLPAILWWVIPLGLTAIAIARMRPAAWSLVVVAALCSTHAVQSPFFWGTPVMWLLPIVAWGLLLGWPAIAVLVKPTLAPFVLAGLTRPRALVIGAAIFGILALPFQTMWFDWLSVIRNSDVSPSYGYTQNLLLLVPVIAWVGHDGRRPALPALPRWPSRVKRTK